MNTPVCAPIAIVGMACRFPGAATLDDFWAALCAGRHGIRPVPAARWDADALYADDAKAPGKANTRLGGFIDDIDRFDAAFFGISPREAAQMDPQQRLLLELAYEALEDAGIAPARLAGSDTSVYVGAMTNDYLRHQLADDYRRIDVHTGAGAGLCMLANRLSYQFDLRGPSVTVDTACSSSLVAAFQACESLWAGHARVALAAGVNLMLDPAFNVFYAKAGLSASDGKCKTFSAAADGIGRGEGAGVVVLKRMSDALAAGDRVYAVIRGGAVNHDGRSNGMTQPNRWAQEQLLRRAFAHAAIDARALGYIELHGTGTLIGDPIEANALAAVLAEAGARERPCLVGSVKSNLGHLEAAAGIASLIKLALSVYHAEVPPSLWFDAPNPHIAFERMPIRLNAERRPWPADDGRRLGGVSSFGLGGTNAHLVVESAPAADAERRRVGGGHHWLFVSARSEAALTAAAASYIEFLERVPASELAAVCASALKRKGVHDFRLSVIAPDKDALIARLQAFRAGAADPCVVHGRFRPGSRRLLIAIPERAHIDLARLAHWLTHAPLARGAWHACRAALQRHGGVLLPAADALASNGEIAASDADFRAWHFAGHYALLAQLVGSVRTVDAILPDGLAQLAAFCAAGALPLDVAVQWLHADLSPAFIECQPPAADFSVACDCPSGRNPAFTAIAWDAPARSWQERVRALAAEDIDVLVLDLADAAGIDAPAQFGLGGEPDGFQRVYARLALHHALDWDACAHDHGFVRLPSYPWQRESYWLACPAADATNISSAAAPPAAVAAAADEPVHPLLGRRLALPAPAWECTLDPERLPYLPDHHVQGLQVLPGAAYAELGLAIHREVSDAAHDVLHDLEFHKALVIGADDQPALHVAYDPSRRGYSVYSRRRPGAAWKLHARGRLSLVAPAAAPRVALAELKQRCAQVVEAAAHYENMDERGLEYGRYFQGVRRLWLEEGGNEVLAWIAADERLPARSDGTRLHPSLLDASLQTLLVPLGARGDTELYIPITIRELKLYRDAPNAFWCHGRLTRAADGIAEGDVVLFDDAGEVIAEARGARAQALTKKDRADELKPIDQWLYEFAWEPAPVTAPPRRAGNWLVFLEPDGRGVAVAERLAAAGADTIVRVLPGEAFEQLGATTFVMARTDKAGIERVLAAATAVGIEGIAYLWGLDAPKADADPSANPDALPVVHLIQLLGRMPRADAPRLVVVTRGAHAVDDEPLATAVHAPLTGLMRVAVNEHPDLRLRAIDIDGDVDTLAYLVEDMLSDSREDETALRGAHRYVPRMVRTHALALDRRVEPAAPTADAGARRAPGVGEVEVALRLAPLTADATPPAMCNGVLAGWGVVTRAGEALAGLEPGDAVLVQLHGQPTAHVTLPAAHVMPLPPHEAKLVKSHAAYISAFIGAHYALAHAARVQPGERVLVQRAASALGLAAIQVARRLGATVHAVVTGAEQGDHVRALGVEHVYDDASLDFAERILQATAGGGVDVVLNVWTGEYAETSYAALASGGRFVDLAGAAADIVPRSNRSIVAIDTRALLVERPEILRRVLTEVCAALRAQEFAPIPVRVVSATKEGAPPQADTAIGAVVAAFDYDPKTLLAPADLFHAKGSYLITGGFGGFGLAVAAWMIEHGARHLVLAGRRGAHTPAAQPALESLRARGARVLAVAADVSSEADVKRMLAEIAEHMPPLKGVFHAAAVLDDNPIAQLAPDQIANAMGAKAAGAWHLHRHTLEAKLDYFVLFSSIASMVGGPGQASYAMACAYLDALARLRRARDLPATAINWGALGKIGMATRYADAERYLGANGVGLFTPRQATELLGRVLRWNPVALGVAIMDWAPWARAYPGWAASPKYGALAAPDAAAPAPAAERPLLAAIAALAPVEREHAIADMLAEILGETLALAPSMIDRNASLLSIGIDSLMAMELQAGVDKKLGVKISTLELMKGNSIAQLAQHVALLLGAVSAGADTVDVPAPARELHLDDAGKIIAQLDHLSDDEVERLLATLASETGAAG